MQVSLHLLFTYLCGVKQNKNVSQSKMELDEKANNICHTQQGKKGDNTSQTSPVKKFVRRCKNK